LRKKEKGEIRMKKQSISAALITALLLISTVSTAFAYLFPIVPHNADAMWVESDTSTYVDSSGFSHFNWTTATKSIGYKFNITICLNLSSSDSVYAWQVAMLYPEIGHGGFLNCTRLDVTAPPTSEFFVTHSTTVSKFLDPSALGGQGVFISESLSGSDSQAGWAATLFWAEFQVMAAPPKGGVYLGVFDISTYAKLGPTHSKTWWEDSFDPPGFHDNTTDSSPSMAVYDAYINYTWAVPPAKPYMGIEGAGSNSTPLVYGPYAPSAVGETFTAHIYVKNIDPAWYLYNLSFTLTWNGTVIQALGAPGANLTIASGWSVITNSVTIALDNTTSWDFAANFTGTAPPLSPSNKVPVANLTLTVMIQESAPPKSISWTDESYLMFSNVVFYDALPFGLLIPPGTSENGYVVVKALIALQLPWLQLSPATQVVGPGPSIGTIIEVDVLVYNLSSHWYTVGIQFRVQYDDAVLSLVSVAEGPFMTDPRWDLYGTFNYSQNEIGGTMVYPFTHVAVLELLLPNGTGEYDQDPLPNTLESAHVNPIVSRLFFAVEAQDCFGGENITSHLNILPFWPPTDKNFFDKDGNYISDFPGHNATVTIEPIQTQPRTIDLFGGSVNDGYGNLVPYFPPYTPYYTGIPSYPAFPVPYGGQGAGTPMDLVFPQSWVHIYGYVTYNYWPVEFKDVGFEVEGPFYHLTEDVFNETGGLVAEAGDYVPEQGQTFYNASGYPFEVLTLPNSYQVWAKFSSITDANGVASYAFRMPWVDYPDFITGVWKITASATVADQEICDTMMFYYERVVYITKVTTDYPSYYHNQFVQVTVDYETHSIEKYPALFSVVITDELGVPIGMALYTTEVGGAVFCTWKTGTFKVSILIPKWAYAGNGAVHVSVYDKDPTEGGQPWQSEYLPDPIINIYPYNLPLSIVPLADNTWGTWQQCMDDNGFGSNGWPTPEDLAIDAPLYGWVLYGEYLTETPDYLNITAEASGGLPFMAPDDIPEYNYAWFVNGISVLNDTMVTTSQYDVTAGVAPFATVGGVYHIVVVVTDKLGNIATEELYVYIHQSPFPPGP
jgi:hypothetical protein